MMIDDYTGSNDLSINELSQKYGFEYNVIKRALIQMDIPIKNKMYRTWNKVKGIKRTDSFKKKHSELMKAQRKGKIWVNKDGISRSIIPAEEQLYLSNGWKRGRGKINSANMTHDSLKKRVLCVETGMVYDSIREAARVIGISKSCIQNVVNNKPHCNTAKGYHWKYLDEEN